MGQYANFIILYSGREGSSALVSMLSAQKGVHVPLFEDLDPHQLGMEQAIDSVPAEMEQIFSSGTFDKCQRHFALFHKDHEKGDSIGFKIRIFSDPHLVAPVLLAHNVKVFVLSRRSFIEYLSGYYFHEMRRSGPDNNSEKFPQFEIARMDAAGQRQALDDIENTKVVLHIRSYFQLAEKLSRGRHRLATYAGALAKAGVPIVPVYYEDFLSDRMGFVAKFLSHLGFANDWPILDSTKLTKVLATPASQKLTGLGWYLGIVLVQFDRFKYGLALRRLNALQKKS